MPLDSTWVVNELEMFLALTDFVNEANYELKSRAGTEQQIVEQAAIVEQILFRIDPDWRTSLVATSYRWDQWDDHVQATRRARSVVLRRNEIQEKLGEDAPRLDATSLHPWIWDGARSLWGSGHFREAVGAAAIKLNAETQNKLGRTDVSETDLFTQAFSENPASSDSPRLRIMQVQGDRTAKSFNRGVRSFAEGCYAAIRNPISHQLGELPEGLALEQLAALSVLARWVDDAVLVKG